MATDGGNLRATWDDLLQAAEFAARRFANWRERGVIGPEQADVIAADYEHLLTAWKQAAGTESPLPAEIAFPPGAHHDSGTAWLHRVWRFIGNEVHRHAAGGRLTLAQVHACQEDVQSHLAAIRRKMQAESPGVYVAEIVERVAERPAAPPKPAATGTTPFADAPRVSQSSTRTPNPATPRRSMLEILLDPRTIQWLLAFGGALMVVGLVILLWVNEFFTPPVVAISLGITNAVVLAVGYWLLQKTRYQMAGRAITLLACLVMPLNLWYYHANHLITIDGHLWVAAVVISALYAGSAWSLKDEMFVYVFVGGITLTGLLILADLPPSPQKFWEIASPATLLVVLGLLAIHIERAFPDDDSPFGRKRFGLAFFWSGHALLAAGLLLVFGAQVAGKWLYEPVFRPWYELWNATPSPIVRDPLRMLAFGLVIAGTYAYVYSDIVVRRIGIYVDVAAFTLIWAQVLLVDLLGITLGIDALIGLFAVTSLLVNLVQHTVTKHNPITRAFPLFGLLLGLLPVVLGLYVYVRALNPNLREVWSETSPPTWSYVVAMLLTAAAGRVGAFVYRDRLRLAGLYFFATGAATMLAAVAFLASMGLTTWPEHAPWMMLIPIGYLIASLVERGQAAERPLVWIGHTATAVMLISSLASAVRGFVVVEQELLNLSLALFFAEAAFFYGLAAVSRRQSAAVHLATAMACGTLWQLMNYWGFDGEYYTLVFAMTGLILLVGYRFAMLDQLATGKVAEAAFQSANTLLSLAFVAAVLMGLSRLAGTQVRWSFVYLCGWLTLLSLAAAGLVRQRGWRRWYFVSSIAQGLLLFLAIQVLSTLTGWQKLEIFSVAVGLVLLVVAHLGWYREQDSESDLVSMSLLMGSLLAGLPLCIATIVDRSRSEFLIANELGFLAVSVLLLGTGFVFQLKSTTLIGSGLTVTYFLTFLIFVPWGRMNTVALALTIGGGLIFGTGLLLSLYRDRLLTLPDRIKRREGLFRVLNWR